MRTGVLQPTCVNMDNRLLIGVEMKGCQVRDWIVAGRYMRISRLV